MDLSQLLKNFNKGYCSWFWDKPLGVDIGYLCYDHDEAYRVGDFWSKVKADWELFRGIYEASSRADSQAKQGVIKLIAVGAYAGVSTIGVGFWAVSKIKNSGE